MTTETETALERQVREEQEQHDATNRTPPAVREDWSGTGAEPEPEADESTPPADIKGQTAAFDATDYTREDLQIPKIDGNAIDKIRVDFSGSVMLDRSAPADVALFNRLVLGGEAELRCAGKVSGTGAGFTTNKEGNLDVVVGKKTLKVETVWVLTPEQL